MKKRTISLFLLAFLLGAIFLPAGISQAQDDNASINFIAQYFVANSASNSISFAQGISGIFAPNFSDSGQISVSFNNFTVNGVYNANYGVGSFRNQGSVAFVNIQPELFIAPAVFIGQTFSENNTANIYDFNYAINLSFNGFRGSGIAVLNLMAGIFSNQFTSVHFSMGKNVIPPPSPNTFSLTRDGDSTLAALTNSQMQAIAATGNNDIQVHGKQSAVATVEGTPSFQGVCAITLSSGINNHVIHRVGVNIDMP